MISFKEALKKAKEEKKTITFCREYDSAYLFGLQNRDSKGTGQHLVILKDNGSIISSENYFKEYNPVLIKKDIIEEIETEKKLKTENRQRKVFVFILEVIAGFIVIQISSGIASLLGMIPIPIVGFVLLIIEYVIMYIFIRLILRKRIYLFENKKVFSTLFCVIATLVLMGIELFKTVAGVGILLGIVGYASVTEVFGWFVFITSKLFGKRMQQNKT